MSKKTFIISAIIILTLASLSFVLSALWPIKVSQDDSAQTNPEFQSAVIKPVDNNIREILVTDRELLENKLKENDIETEDFRVRYEEETDQFAVDLYTQEDRSLAVLKVYEQLKGYGIQQPEKLDLVYSGPFNYDNYELIPQEKIDEIMERYSKR